MRLPMPPMIAAFFYGMRLVTVLRADRAYEIAELVVRAGSRSTRSPVRSSRARPCSRALLDVEVLARNTEYEPAQERRHAENAVDLFRGAQAATRVNAEQVFCTGVGALNAADA